MYYQKHLFLCTNQKAPGKTCCENTGGTVFFDYMKAKLRALGLDGPGHVRLSKSGCLGRCKLGPGLVIYPEGVWYTYTSCSDLDDIIQVHLIDGERVQRLLMEEVDSGSGQT